MMAKLRAERERVEMWRDDNIANVGTPEFRRSTLAHRLLVDLIARDGGSPADRAYVAREMAAIESGMRDGETAR